MFGILVLVMFVNAQNVKLQNGMLLKKNNYETNNRKKMPDMRLYL